MEWTCGAPVIFLFVVLYTNAQKDDIGNIGIIRCPQNQTFLNESADCFTCKNIHQAHLIKCALNKTPKCYCKEGFIWEDENKTRCILAQDCPLRCTKNEIEVECKSSCPPTCEDPYPLPCFNKRCLRGCHCKKGYIREVPYGRCIRREFCPVVDPVEILNK